MGVNSGALKAVRDLAMSERKEVCNTSLYELKTEYIGSDNLKIITHCGH